jgi:hypothetical protein|nr:MAG TPA: hypothetical protein [Caudoviricetes sp.]
MIEKINITDALGEWPESNSVSKLVGIDNTGDGKNISPDKLFSEHPIRGKNFTTDKGLVYASIKSLGTKKGDGKKSVLLVNTYDTDKRNNYRGIMGRLFGIRGSVNSGLAAYMWDVVCVKAYEHFKFSHSDTSLKCGKCAYNGENYIAVELGSAAYFDIFFTGFYSGNCIFLSVEESDITWLQ